MLQISSQVSTNLAAQVGRHSFYTGSIYTLGALCIVLVKDTVQIPTTHTGVISYINSALNGSNFHGGTPGNETNCLAIIDTIKSCSYAGNNCIVFDGPSTTTVKNTGKVGGAIIGWLFNNAAAPSTLYPLTSAITEVNANLYVGTSDERSIYNYMLITDSVGINSASTVILDSIDLVAGAEVIFYGASLKFSNVE